MLTSQQKNLFKRFNNLKKIPNFYSKNTKSEGNYKVFRYSFGKKQSDYIYCKASKNIPQDIFKIGIIIDLFITADN